MKRSIHPAALVLLALGFSAHAQTMKPGLWEISNQMQGGSGEMEKAMAEAQKAMASMPPEQRKVMQDMMAKQGVTLGSGGGGGMTAKVCITKEMIDRNEISTAEGDCKTNNSPRVGNTMKVSYVCTKPPSSGEGQITFSGSESYTSKMTVNTTATGKSEKMTMDSQGKWLSAECGAIKPFVPPKK